MGTGLIAARRTALSIALLLTGAASLGAAPASGRFETPPGEAVRTVCSGDVCMPMRCRGEACRPLPPLSARMKWSDLLSRPKAKPQARIAYGADPNQVGELWIPEGRGAHPVIAMIHGGCWTASVADLTIMDYAAEDLRRRGVAVWNIEYRRVDQPSGGYPGTYQDVAAALDALPKIAREHHLRMGKGGLVVAGHSAGGHLALWAAARGKLRKTSVLRTPHPVKIGAVVDIAGIPNLQTDTDTACGAEPVAAMAGKPGPERPVIYADTSPAALLPLRTPQWVIHGAQDVTVKPEVGNAYAVRARAAGDKVTVVNPPGGHVEEISPGTLAWSTIADVIISLAKSGAH